jgi:hypothetical protein
MRLAIALVGCLIISALGACTSTSKPPANQPEPTAASMGIPPGQLPPVGQCRVWIPGKPPGHQAKARSCDGIERVAPAGSWIVYRPGQDKKVVHVRVVDDRRPGVVVVVRVYDAQSGAYLRTQF